MHHLNRNAAFAAAIAWALSAGAGVAQPLSPELTAFPVRRVIKFGRPESKKSLGRPIRVRVCTRAATR